MRRERRSWLKIPDAEPFQGIVTSQDTPPPPSHLCVCGRSISPDSWKRLPLVGTMDNGRGKGELIELRNCSCGSTIATAIGEHEPPSDPSSGEGRRAA